jgi:hypothetical protein
MDAIKTASKWLVLALLVVFCVTGAATAGTVQTSDYCPSHGDRHEKVFDGSTLCRWQRTWHGPNDIRRPLTAYYVPRPADPCQYGSRGHWGGDSGCSETIESNYLLEGESAYENGVEVQYGYSDSPGLQAGMERLGQIPNDLGIAGGVPAAAVQPGR